MLDYASRIICLGFWASLAGILIGRLIPYVAAYDWRSFLYGFSRIPRWFLLQPYDKERGNTYRQVEGEMTGAMTLVIVVVLMLIWTSRTFL
jgi:hypothetical protein